MVTPYTVLVILPEGMKDEKDIRAHIQAVMAPHSTLFAVPPYISVTFKVMRGNYQESKWLRAQYPTFQEYVRSLEYNLDAEGNAISTQNRHGLYRDYSIGGRLDGFLRTGQVAGEGACRLVDNMCTVPHAVSLYYQQGFRPAMVVDTDGIVHWNEYIRREYHPEIVVNGIARWTDTEKNNEMYLRILGANLERSVVLLFAC